MNKIIEYAKKYTELGLFCHFTELRADNALAKREQITKAQESILGLTNSKKKPLGKSSKSTGGGSNGRIPILGLQLNPANY